MYVELRIANVRNVRQFDNYFLQAQRVRLAIRAEFDAVFRHKNPLDTPSLIPHSQEHSLPLSPDSPEGVDIIIHPSTISTAPPFPSSISPPSTSSSTDAYTQDILNVPSSLAGLPAMSIPVPLRLLSKDDQQDGLPVGVQIVAQWGNEAVIFRVSDALEKFMER
jgi:aspartyl-tRNA(Asn)/glutamyl-tRNA(Gln) amidotransferase subunit A